MNIQIINDFIPAKTCDVIIKEFNYLSEKFRKISDGRKLYLNPPEAFINTLIKELLEKINNTLNKTYYAREVMLSVYETNSSLLSHIDHNDINYQDNLGALFYLNDDFDGGELYFANKNVSFKPAKGQLILFPCNQKEYIHGVSKITKGIRYSIPVEITLNKNQALSNF